MDRGCGFFSMVLSNRCPREETESKDKCIRSVSSVIVIVTVFSDLLDPTHARKIHHDGPVDHSRAAEWFLLVLKWKDPH